MRQAQHRTTEFQERCIKKVVDYIKEIIGEKIIFKEVIGRKEMFYQSQIKSIDIYVYSDEAGFMLSNKEWVICEKPDYHTQEDLMEDFLLRLKNEIVKQTCL